MNASVNSSSRYSITILSFKFNPWGCFLPILD
nr:MAG TPA: hypothetical protein [Bacteriophage sp.]